MEPRLEAKSLCLTGTTNTATGGLDSDTSGQTTRISSYHHAKARFPSGLDDDFHPCSACLGQIAPGIRVAQRIELSDGGL